MFSVAQVGLEMKIFLPSASQAVEITGLYYHTWIQILSGRISANTAVSQL